MCVRSRKEKEKIIFAEERKREKRKEKREK
jgi:hypothetical protein